MIGEYRSVVMDTLEMLSRLGKGFFERFTRDAYDLVAAAAAKPQEHGNKF